MSAPRIPLATYRLQLGRDFTFQHAAGLVPYLRELGISHCYTSPFLKARAGSDHGYDIVDHGDLNPEIGTREDFERFVAALRAHEMGLILDMVPNHMGVGGADNPWWLDVLENGEASAFAAYFDLDWRPAKPELRGKLLLPFLEDHYGTVLEKGLLQLGFDGEQGRFGVAYREHYFPLDPKTYPLILRRVRDALPAESAGHETLSELIGAFDELPARWETAPERREVRVRDAASHRRALAELCRGQPALADRLARELAAFNGEPGRPGSFDPLHELLEQQAYRLAHWIVANDEINYRRFFDINTLAGIRVERPEVFAATHRFVLDLIAAGKVQGLRIDHPDGLYNPADYFGTLQKAIVANGFAAAPAIYTVAEKILSADEQLPGGWPVHGTTGYDFANQINGLYVHADGGSALTRLYENFIGRSVDFNELLCERKKLVMRALMAGELTVLANLLKQISEGDRHTRDYTLNALRDALMEVVACFPVYRSYISPAGVTEQDRRYVEQAVMQATRRSPAADVSVFAFIRRVLLMRANSGAAVPGQREALLQFVMKFQQYTAPVMAKGLEDTSFYVYNRFVALNEVGGDPRRFGMPVATFHQANIERRQRWPQTLLSTSTHDTKRSEDVRVRLDVLSEIPATWRSHVNRWSRLNEGRKQTLDERPAPSREDEYLLYQTLIGTWPLEVLDEARLAAYRERIERYMRKAAREAKVRTSWINPNAAYEDALTGFVRGLLDQVRKNAFVADLAVLAKQVALLGMLNGLSQTLIKLTAPGVPDIYQGTEIWNFSLVDPDNRRPVDYARRRELLGQLRALASSSDSSLAARVRLLLNTWEDGRPKLYVTWRALALRWEHPEVFQSGDYLPLAVQGVRTENVCAYARRSARAAVITAAPRGFSRLVSGRDSLPLGVAVWQDTRVEAPDPGDYTNVLTGETITAEERHERWWLRCASMFARFPVALLLRQAPAADAPPSANLAGATGVR